MKSEYIYGIHGPGGEYLMKDAGTPGWIVFTHGLGHNPDHKDGFDYSPWANQGFGVIARLNNGYGSEGTIPEPLYYNDFARRVRNWVEESDGCSVWIIGNEPNHEQERPSGQHITPLSYATCFVVCEKAIHGLPGHENDHVIPAPVAVWNNTTPYPGNERGDWVQYMVDVFRHIKKQGGTVNAIALHTYTHGEQPFLVDSDARMGAPFADRYFHFNAYQDFMEAIPDDLRDVPVYITETDQDVAWRNVNAGWVKRAYANIDRWNKTPGNQQILALVLYRWSTDKWHFSDKGGVREDFKDAMRFKYQWSESKPLIPDVNPKGFQIVVAKTVNVRAQPGYSTKLGTVVYSQIVFIRGDPVPADSLVWWPIRSYGLDGTILDGWMAEATGGGMRLLAPAALVEISVRKLRKPFAGSYRLTQGFGENAELYKRWSYDGVALKGHNGLDWATPESTSIFAIDAGRVRQSGYDEIGFGNYVVVAHAWGDSIYAHLSKRAVVVNQLVECGECIGLSGNTGNSTGPHLHFGMRVAPYRRTDGWGGYCDPAPLLED